MHKLLERAPVLYAAFLLLFTIPFLVSLYFGDQLIMSHGVVWFILNILIEATLTAFCAAKRKISTTAENIVSQFLPLLSLLYIGMTGAVIREVNAFLLILHAMICFVCCFVVSFLYKNGPVFRVACAVFNSILLSLLLAASFFAMTFGQIRQDSIANRVMSPNRSYTAVVIDSDQGALGGNTLVDIEHNASEINVWFGRFTKITRVYTGEWGEFDTMSMEWKNDSTLLINGKSYAVD
jgi:hypothetical protein